MLLIFNLFGLNYHLTEQYKDGLENEASLSVTQCDKWDNSSDPSVLLVLLFLRQVCMKVVLKCVLLKHNKT